MNVPAEPDLHRVVEAFNAHSESENKIHDDEVAARYGFRGALVAGVSVFAYMAQLPVRRWGPDWLDHGGISVRFTQPVYDGEQVVVAGRSGPDDELKLEVRGPDGGIRATAVARRRVVPTDRAVPPGAELPAIRPTANPDSLAAGTVLGSLHDRFDPAEAPEYLASVREDLPIFVEGRYAHPGWLLRFANSVLVRNVALGPWIHVSSDIICRRAVTVGQFIDVRGQVLEEYERRGHRFAVLDVAVLAGGDVAQRVTHTAIYAPRRASTRSHPVGMVAE